MVLSSSLSLYMGLEDVLSAKFNRELMIRINAKGPEESETIVRQLRETASEMDLPIENLIEYEFRSLFAIQEKNSIRFGIRSIWEIGGLKQVYLIPLESYNRNSAQPIELKENEVFLLSSGIEFPWESIRLGSNELKIKGRGGDLSLVTERLRQSAITFFLVIHDQEQLNRVLSESEGLVQNIGNNTLIGCDISGTAEDRNRYSAAIIEKLKDFKSGTFESKQMARRYFLNVYGLYLLIAFLLGIQFLLATGIIFYLKLVSEGSFHQHRREMMVRAGLSRDEVMTSVKTQNAILFFIPFIGSILLFLLPTKMIRMLLEAFFLYNFKTYLFSAMVVVAVVLSITFRMYHAVILMSRKLPG